MNCKAAPAGADLRNRHAGLQLKLAGGVDQLVALRLFERFMLGVAEVRAGILHLIVEKQTIEFSRDVVVMTGVSGGAPDRVGLMPATQAAPYTPHQLLRAVGIKPGAVNREQQQEIVDSGAVLERQRTIHIGFGGAQFRIDEKPGVELAIVEADRDVWPGSALAKHMHLAVGIVDPQGALTNEASKQARQQKHAEVLRGR